MIVSMRGQIVQLVELIQAEIRQNADSKAVRYLYSYLYSKLLENCAAPSIRYIAEHYDLPITVNQLAEMESYNVTYYNDWFKQQTGCSPSLYLRRAWTGRRSCFWTPASPSWRSRSWWATAATPPSPARFTASRG